MSVICAVWNPWIRITLKWLAFVLFWVSTACVVALASEDIVPADWRVTQYIAPSSDPTKIPALREAGLHMWIRTAKFALFPFAALLLLTLGMTKFMLCMSLLIGCLAYHLC